MPHPLLNVSQSDVLIKIVDSTDLDLHCLLRQSISGFNRTKVKSFLPFCFLPGYSMPSIVVSFCHTLLFQFGESRYIVLGTCWICSMRSQTIYIRGGKKSFHQNDLDPRFFLVFVSESCLAFTIPQGEYLDWLQSPLIKYLLL